MATNTDWSKFQRRQLQTLLSIKKEAGDIKLRRLDESIIALKAEMEKEDIDSVIEAINDLD